MVIIILAKLIEATSASVSIEKDLKKDNIASVAIIALEKCNLILSVFNLESVIINIIETGNKPNKHRKKTISKVGKSSVSFFTKTVINAKKITDKTFNIIANRFLFT